MTQVVLEIYFHHGKNLAAVQKLRNGQRREGSTILLHIVNFEGEGGIL